MSLERVALRSVPTPSADEQLPTITVAPGQLAGAEVDAWAVLAKASLYRQGRLLVRVSQPGDPDRPTKASLAPWAGPLIVQVSAPWLRAELASRAKFLKPDVDRARPTDPPLNLCVLLIDRVDSSGLPELMGIIQHPTLRSDGSLLDRPGYDAASGLLYLPQAGLTWPTVPQQPTRDDALAAVARLRQPLREFPFSDPDGTPTGTSEAVALALMLTVPIRRSLDSAPGFAASSPTPGTGKGKLLDVAGVLATGLPVPATAHCDDPNEERKRLAAALMEGRPIVSIDNIERVFTSEVICSILTQATFWERVLGRSENVTLSTRVVLMANGNNLTIAGDLIRRFIVCRLDAQSARPDEIEHSFDAVQEAQRDRGELVVAALTVVRAYLVAHQPLVGVRPYGSFEQWSSWVRCALIWLGVPDPCGGRTAMEAGDPSRDVALGVLSAWFEEFGSAAATVAAAITEAEHNETLRLAFNLIPSKTGKATPHSVGQWVRRHRDRPYPLPGGDAILAFRQSGVDRVSKSAVWSVQNLSRTGAGDCGGLRGSFPMGNFLRSESIGVEMTPADSRSLPQQVVKYRLSDSPSLWCTALGETEQGLRDRYGARLIEVLGP